jgi:hypothetical protein
MAQYWVLVSNLMITAACEYRSEVYTEHPSQRHEGGNSLRNTALSSSVTCLS